MRILILGAGGIGGYFGGRATAGGADVTFLVRPARAAQLARDGLVIRSALGDLATPVRTVTAETLEPGWGAIVLACKAYDLEGALAAVAPAAAGALIVPQLNGVRHLERLDSAFGAENVAGGSAVIGITLEPDGTIRHLNRAHTFTLGARGPAQEARCAAFTEAFGRGGFEMRNSPSILLDMWEKYCFLCTLAAITTLLRGPVGAIARSDHGAALMREAFADCVAVATAAGHPPRERFLTATAAAITDPDSAMAASMLRDLQRGARVEAEHIVGDMLGRARALGREATALRAAYAGLQVYQAGQAARG